MEVTSAGAARAAGAEEGSFFQSLFKRMRESAMSAQSVEEKKRQCVEELNQQMTRHGTNVGSAQKMNAATIAHVAMNGLKSSAAALNTKEHVKIHTSQGTYEQKQESRVKKNEKFETGYSITISGLPSNVKMQAVDSAGKEILDAVTEGFAKYSVAQDQVSFKILGESSTEEVNTFVKIFCLSRLTVLNKSSSTQRSAVTGNTGKLLENLKTSRTKSGEIFAIHLFVTVIPSDDCHLPHDKVVVMGKGQSVSDSFMAVIPEGLNATQKKALMKTYVNSLNVEKVVNEIFKPDEADKAGTLKVEGVKLHTGIAAVGKGKMAESTDGNSTVTSNEPWPLVCCIAAFEKCGNIELVSDISSNLAISLGNSSLTQACKITQLGLHLTDTDHRTANKYSIYTTCAAFDQNCIPLSKLKELFKEASICMKKDVDDYKRLSSHLTHTMKIDSGCFEKHLIQNTWDACTCFFDKETVQCTYPLKDDISKQIDSKIKSGQVIGEKVALLAIATSVHYKLIMGEDHVAGISRPPFECSVKFPNALNMGFPARIFALIREKLLEDPPEGPYESSCVKNITWSIFVSNIKFNSSEVQPNLFSMIFYLLCASILMSDSILIYQVLEQMSLDMCDNMPIFHQDSMSKDLKKESLTHFFLCLFANLFWTVDILYGMPNRLSSSWLKVKVENSRSVSHKDVVSNARRQPRLSVTLRNGVFYDYSKSINPLMILKILAYIHKYGQITAPNQLEAVQAELDSMSVEDAKTSAVALIASIYEFKKSKMPMKKLGHTKEVSTTQDFDENKDRFDIPDVEQAFDGELPRDFNFAGEPFKRADGAASIDDT
jgi:hypothetical protein